MKARNKRLKHINYKNKIEKGFIIKIVHLGATQH